MNLVAFLMKMRHRIAALCTVLTLVGSGGTGAQVAGATRLGATTTETEQVIAGWSAKQSILGRPVYNASGERLGKALDLIVGTDKRVTFLIVETLGTMQTHKHLVAVPAVQLQVRGGRLVLPDADRQALASQPAFLHAPITRTQSAVVDQAMQEVDKAGRAIAQLERNAAQDGSDAKARTDQQIRELRQNQKAVEDKVAEMDAAGAAQWQALEAEVGQASARLRSALRKASM